MYGSSRRLVVMPRDFAVLSRRLVAAATETASSPRVRLGPSNGRLEGLNSRTRLISHRSFGFHSAAPPIALVYLCCSGIVVDLPR
jgi:transposase